jgi:hypothetical protein
MNTSARCGAPITTVQKDAKGLKALRKKANAIRDAIKIKDNVSLPMTTRLNAAKRILLLWFGRAK